MARILDFADGFTSSLEPLLSGIAAAKVGFTPASGLTSDNVQDAIEEIADQKGVANGLASLDGNGKVPIEQIPAIAVTSVHVVADIAERDDLEVEEGDVALVDDDGDGNKASYIFDGSIWRPWESDAALALHAASTSTHGVAGNIVGTTDAQVLANKDYDGGTASNTSRVTLPKNTKANLDGLTRKEATLVYASDQKKAFIDDGTNLVPVGNGSGGSLNFIENGDAELGLTGYNTYKDAAQATPEDGEGGTSDLTLSVSSTDPLSGLQHFKLSKPASNCQGQGLSVDFEIDRARLGKVLQSIFDYRNSSTLASGDLKIWVRDLTNNVNTELTGSTVLAHGLPSMSHVASFQTAIDSLDYRLIFHVASTNASAWDFEFDNVTVGPVTMASGNSVEIFRAVKTSGNDGGGSDMTSFTYIDKDTAGGFNLSAGTYTIQEPGDYYFGINAQYSAAQAKGLAIFKNGVGIGAGYGNESSSFYKNNGAMASNLVRGDVISWRSTATAATVGQVMVFGFKVSQQTPTKAYGTNTPAIFTVRAVTPSVTPSLDGNYIDVVWPQSNITNTLGFPFDGTNVTITKPGWYTAKINIPTSLNRSTAGSAEYRITIVGPVTEYGIDAKQFYASGTLLYAGQLTTVPFYASAGQTIKARFTTTGVTAASYGYSQTANFSLHEVPAPVTTLAPGKMKKYQTKYLPSDVTTTGTTLTSLGFNNLTIGKTYRISAQVSIVAADNWGGLNMTNNSVQVARFITQVAGAGPSDRTILTGIGRPFVAAATTVVVTSAGGTFTIEGDGTSTETYVTLEECDDLVPTTDWS